MTYTVERIATGDVTAYALLNTDAYVIANWTRQTDQSYIEWGATMPERGMTAPFVGGLERGSGILYGNYSGIIEFFMLTALMQNYITENILNGKPIEIVTVYAYDDFSRELAVFTGELVAPFAANAETTYSPFGHTVFSNNQFLFRAGTKKTISYLLLETGDYFLLENGGKIALETQD